MDFNKLKCSLCVFNQKLWFDGKWNKWFIWKNIFLDLFVNYLNFRAWGGKMVSALNSGSCGPYSSPGCGHCAVFLGKTLYSHCASLSDGLARYQTPVFSWNRNQARLQPGVPLGSYANFAFNIQLSVKTPFWAIHTEGLGAFSPTKAGSSLLILVDMNHWKIQLFNFPIFSVSLHGKITQEINYKSLKSHWF